MRRSPIRKRVRRKKIQVLDLDITSLLDILVILLVFLLKSYNSSGVVFNVPKGITLPRSNSQTINNAGVIVQVSTTAIYVDDKIILDIQSTKGRKVFNKKSNIIIPLFEELTQKKKTFKQVAKSSHNANEFSGIVNLIVDKSIKYNFLKKLLNTCASAGYQKYKFVVLGEDS
jgi:biopolymer transport protein ExbD